LPTIFWLQAKKGRVATLLSVYWLEATKYTVVKPLPTIFWLQAKKKAELPHGCPFSGWKQQRGQGCQKVAHHHQLKIT